MQQRMYKISNNDFSISKGLKNCFVLKNQTNISEIQEKNRLVILLFCGWYGTDVKAMKNLLEYSIKTENIKYGFKDYLEEEKMYFFNENLNPKFKSPCYLFYNNNELKFIKQGQALDKIELFNYFKTLKWLDETDPHFS